jgi:hypothetical protein
MHSVWAAFQTTARPSTLPIQLADIAPAIRISPGAASSVNSAGRFLVATRHHLPKALMPVVETTGGSDEMNLITAILAKS